MNDERFDLKNNSPSINEKKKKKNSAEKERNEQASKDQGYQHEEGENTMFTGLEIQSIDRVQGLESIARMKTTTSSPSPGLWKFELLARDFRNYLRSSTRSSGTPMNAKERPRRRRRMNKHIHWRPLCVTSAIGIDRRCRRSPSRSSGATWKTCLS